MAHCTFACLFLLLLTMRWFRPEGAWFYPRCPVHSSTGLLCPGCGGTRAIANLLHGHFAEAWHFNPLVVSTLPLTLGFLTVSYRRALKASPFAWPRLNPLATISSLIVTLAFTVLRNL